MNEEGVVQFAEVLVGAWMEAAHNEADTHEACSLLHCDWKKAAYMEANKIQLDELRRDVDSMRETLDEALVDLAPVQTLLKTVELLVAEVDTLQTQVRRLQATSSREALAWEMQ